MPADPCVGAEEPCGGPERAGHCRRNPNSRLGLSCGCSQTPGWQAESGPYTPPSQVRTHRGRQGANGQDRTTFSAHQLVIRRSGKVHKLMTVFAILRPFSAMPGRAAQIARFAVRLVLIVSVTRLLGCTANKDENI